MSESSWAEADVAELAKYGAILTAPIFSEDLPCAHLRTDLEATIAQTLMHGGGSRGVALLGASGTGKTALVGSIARRLAAAGWHLLRMSSADFLSGTMWLGEWQTRLNKLVAQLSRRRVVLYCPNLSELEMVGRSSSSDANVASALAPYIERGDIALLGEATEIEFKKGTGSNPSLRRLFHCINLPAATAEQTRAIVELVALDLQLDVDGSVLDRLCELADFIGVSSELPGRAVELLRRIATHVEKTGATLSESAILQAIRTATGLPVELLDDTVQLDRVALRDFFESRVMGQPDAIDAAVDLVTLIKAGLTDPNKPLGVLLFVGPTGVGKTELARALAEYCFGHVSRLLRIDMSEYASYEAFERLIGKAGQPGILTSAVREQPFSIVLFDEFEKGHFNVFDLCLQIFDAGRLTDSSGQKTDFHRTIIVLTSNVGVTTNNNSPIGFVLDNAADTREDQTRQALQRIFRPEFLNRIDRIVQFQPLSAAVAEQIARREIARVLERQGIRRRTLTIDFDPSIVPLLLREGYSKVYGARPLKRAIERLLLLPLARAMADGRIRPHSLVRLVARHGQVQLHIPRLERAEETSPAPPVFDGDVQAHLAALTSRVKGFSDRCADLSARKSALLARIAADDFQSRVGESRGVYEQVYVIDSVLSRAENVRRGLQRLSDFCAEAGQHRPRRARQRMESFTARVEQTETLLNCQQPKYLGDAVVTLTLLSRLGPSLGAMEQLANMYVHYARRTRFTAETLDDHQFESPAEDSISLLIAGVGAFALLGAESGLHVATNSVGRDHEQEQREVIRIDVAALDPASPAIQRNDVQLDIHPLKGRSGRLVKRLLFDVRALHAPTATTLRICTDGERANLIERVMPLLQARISIAAESQPRSSTTPVVRRYKFGPSQLVRDLRTGRRTGRLKAMLAGHIAPFLLPITEEAPTNELPNPIED